MLRNGTWENSSTIQQKDCLTINSIAFGALNTSGWECLIFVGRKNGSIAIYSPANPADPIKVMQGHKSNGKSFTLIIVLFIAIVL
jgi:hypothetical protein